MVRKKVHYIVIKNIAYSLTSHRNVPSILKISTVKPVLNGMYI